MDIWRRSLIGLPVIVGTSTVACGAGATTVHSAANHPARVASTTGLCGLTTSAPKVKHVVVIFMENNS